jgi:hypothetical protein
MGAEHRARRCDLLFPETGGYSPGMKLGQTEAALNAHTGGWGASFDHVLFVDGRLDPWRSAGLSSDYRPGAGAGGEGKDDEVANDYNTTAAPVFIVENGNHCPELWLQPGDPHTWPVVQSAVGIMKGWVDEWRTKRQ